MTTVWLLHGKESNPSSKKIVELSRVAQTLGCTTFAPDFQGMSLVERVDALAGMTRPEGKFIMVGSSMGGYLSVVCSGFLKPDAMLLLAPALYLPGYDCQYPRTKCQAIEIIHGWNDRVVPWHNSVRFCQFHSVPLHLVPDGHILEESMPTMINSLTRLLEAT